MANIWNSIKNKIYKNKEIGSIASADILGTIIAGSFWMILPILLPSEDFGMLNYFLAIASFSFGMALFSTRDTITVYSSKSVQISSTLFFVCLVSGTAALIITYFLFSKIEIGILALFFILNDLGFGILLGRRQHKKYVQYVLSQKILVLIFGLSFFYLFGVDGILFGFILSYLHFTYLIYKEFSISKIDFKLLKTHFGFIFNNYIINIAGSFRSHLDKIIIGSFLSFSILGNYSLSVQLFSLMMLLTNSIYKYTLSLDSRGIDTKKIKSYAIYSSIIISMLGFFILPLIIPFVFPKYLAAIDSIKIISLTVIPATIGQILSSKLLGNEKSRHILQGRILSAGIMISLLLLLGNTYELIGISLAFLLSTTSYSLYLFFISKKIMQI